MPAGYVRARRDHGTLSSPSSTCTSIRLWVWQWSDSRSIRIRLKGFRELECVISAPWGILMKKILIAASLIAASASAASAADLAARPYTKAPPPIAAAI